MATSLSLGSAGLQNALTAQQERMMQGAKVTADTSDAKIDKGARDFEAVLVGSWLQQAEQSFATVPGAEDDENAGQRDQTMSFGVQQLANSLAASGGIGIGKMVAKAMHARVDGTAGDAASAAAPHGSVKTFEKIRETH